MPVKVAINGYGTIGKRVADAVAAQDDMKIVGVAKVRPNFEARMAVEKGYPLYASSREVLPKFQKAGLRVAGTLEDLVREVHVVVDATPEDSGYRGLYEEAGVKGIWQGGEHHGLTNLSFFGAFVTATRSPAFNSNPTCPSSVRNAGSSLPRVSTSTRTVSGITSGRFVSACGQIGVTTNASTVG